MCSSQLSNELLIAFGGLATNLVVEVNHREDDPQVATELQQHSQQGHGIGATRDCDSQSIASF
jgi:hypothetical protein